jgi:rhamnogalacturonyl hydrolase YesR
MRKVKILFSLLLCILYVVPLYAQDQSHTKQVLRKIANRIIKSTPYKFINTKTKKEYSNLKGAPFSMNVKVESQYNHWHYTNGVLDIAMMELANRLNDDKYLKYVQKNMQFVFNPDNLSYFHKQYKKAMKEPDSLREVSNYSWYMFFRMIRLDDYGTIAASLVDLYQHYKDLAYEKYFDKAAAHVLYFQPRLKDSTIARHFPHNMTVWGDDLYMSVSLLARMGELTGNPKYFDYAAKQVIHFHKYLWDPDTQLYYHCYFSDTKTNGVAFWGRANGWIMMAQADLLSALPKYYSKRSKLIKLFRQQVRGIARYQSKSGLWHQLLNKSDSFLETSASAMFTFSIARGVNRGWLPKDFAQVARFGWKGLLTKISDNGDISDICPGTGIQPSLPGYYLRPQRTDIPMGGGSVLRAGAAILKMPHYHSTPAYKFYHLVKDRREK